MDANTDNTGLTQEDVWTPEQIWAWEQSQKQD